MTAITTTERELSRPQFIAIVASLMALNALAIDVVLPGLPAMAAQLNAASANEQQLVIGVYMISMGVGMLFYGPISDRFGRRAPLFFGIVLYVVAALSAILAPSFATLLLLRAAQGLGAAATRVVATAAVRDNYSGRDMAQVMSLVMMVFMVVPIIAPLMGQAVLLVLPWEGIFLFMAAVAGTVGVIAFFKLPESLPIEQRRPLTPKAIVGGFWIVFTNPSAMFYGFAGTVMFGALFAFVSTSEQIYRTAFGVGEWFGVAFAVNGIMLAAANFLNSRVVQQLGMRRVAHTAMFAYTALGIALVVISHTVGMSLWAWLPLIALTLFMFGLCGANFNSLAMEPLGRVAGTAASVFGFLQTAGGAAVGTFIGLHFDGTVRPIAVGFLCCGVATIAMVLIAERGRLFGTGHDAPAATVGGGH